MRFDLLQKYPAVADLQKAAKRRIPHLAWEYLECGTGNEQSIQRNLDSFARITMLPQFFKGKVEPDISITLFGQIYHAPFGIAPIGLSGLIWPGAEAMLAQTAVRCQIPYTLSTVAAETPEKTGSLVGKMGWFQLYPPRHKKIRADLLKRASENGFKTIVVTADLPIPGRRERLTRAGLKMPPAITPRFVLQGISHPAWAMGTLKHGLPYLKTMEKYANSTQMAKLSAFVNQNIGGTLTWDYLKEIRDEWQESIVVKGLWYTNGT